MEKEKTRSQELRQVSAPSVKKNTPQTEKRVRAFRIGALDVVIILAVVLAIAFPIVRFFAGEMSRAETEQIDITVRVSGISPSALNGTPRVFLHNDSRELGKVATIKSLDTDNVTFSISTKATTTAGGMTLLLGDIYAAPGLKFEIVIGGSVYTALILEIGI